MTYRITFDSKEATHYLRCAEVGCGKKFRSWEMGGALVHQENHEKKEPPQAETLFTDSDESSGK